MTMSQSFYFAVPEAQSLAEVSNFQPPSYSITHGPDKALRWDPPADSDELAIALSYHFPVEKTLKRKMQAATEKFLRQEVHIRIVDPKPHQTRATAVRPISEQIPGLLSFDSNTLEEVKEKRKRRAYEQAERAKVRSNRGNACEVHRRQKLKCDPIKCKRNGRFQRSQIGELNPALASSSRINLPEKRTLRRADIGSSYQQEPHQGSSFQDEKPANEPINMLFASNMNPFTPSSVSALENSNLIPYETEEASAAEIESQFMGFESEFLAFGDSFSFKLDPPHLLSHTGDVDTRYSWKSDEFVLSVLSHSMYT